QRLLHRPIRLPPLARLLLNLPPLEFGTAAGDPHCLPEADDDGAGAEVSEEADETAGAVKSERATRLDEQCCPGQEADDGDQDGRAVAAEPNGDGDGPVEGGERQLIAQPPLAQPA